MAQHIRKGQGLLCLLLLLFNASAASSLSASGHSSELTESSFPRLQTLNTSQDILSLETGQPRTLGLSWDQKHTFGISLTSNQFLHVLVQQQGIDVVVTVTRPNEPQPEETDSPTGTRGIETISLIAADDGDYRIEVRPGERGAAPGKYTITVNVGSPVSQNDQARITASAAYIAARKLRSRGDAQSLELARTKFDEALAGWRAVGDRERQAVVLMSIGRSYRMSQNLPKAVASYQEAIELWKELGNLDAEALTLNEIGRSYQVSNEPLPMRAIEFYREALTRFEAVSDSSGQASTYNNIGFAYNSLSNPDDAVPYFERGLAIARDSNDLYRQFLCLNGLGGAFQLMGSWNAALEKFQEGLTIARNNLKQEARIAEALNNVGVASDDIGDLQQALDSYQEALQFKSLPIDMRVTLLHNVGMLHALQGDTDSAIATYKDALKLLEQRNTPETEGLARNGLGFALATASRWDEAKEQYPKALLLFEKSKSFRWQAYTLTNLGWSYAETGDNQKALDYYERALAIWNQPKVNDPQGKAYTLNKLGELQTAIGTLQQANITLQDALSLSRKIKDPRGEAVTLLGLARVASAHGNLGEASRLSKVALAIVETLRQRGSRQSLQMSYLASKHEVYEFAVDVQMRLHEHDVTAGHDREALLISERFRARTLIDTLSRGSVDVRAGVDPVLRLRREDVEKRLLDMEEQQRQRARSERNDHKGSLDKDISDLRAEMNRIDSEIRKNYGRYADITQLLPLSLASIEQDVAKGKDTLLLEYMLGEQRSYLWVVSRDGFRSFVLPARSVLESQARRVNCIVSSKDLAEAKERPGCAHVARGDLTTETQKLSTLLLGPVAKQLTNKRLVIVADGELQYLPFGVLPLPAGLPTQLVHHDATQSPRYTPLFVSNEVVYLPSAATLSLVRPSKDNDVRYRKTAAIVADPVFEPEDSRLSGVAVASNGPLSRSKSNGRDLPLARLLSSAYEAQIIKGFVAPSQRLVATGFDANRRIATSPELAEYRTVHFATHAIVNDQRPELSGIALSRFDRDGHEIENSFLTLEDIYNLKLPSDLVVLSACNTAVGKRIRGEGLLSLTRGFIYAGSRRVVSSLWKADDQATAELMRHFYRHMYKDKIAPSSALRAAQIDLWKESPSKSPYYWGAFIFQGEWR